METEKTKYRTDVAGINEDTWSRNGMEYDTIAEAKEWLNKLSQKWFGFDMSRIVPVSTPSNQKIDYENDVFYQNFRKGVEVKHQEKYDEPEKVEETKEPEGKPERKFHNGELVVDLAGAKFKVARELGWSNTFGGYQYGLVDPDAPKSNVGQETIISEQHLKKAEPEAEPENKPKKDFIKEHIIIAGIPKYQPKQKYESGDKVLYLSVSEGKWVEGHVESAKYFEKPNELTDKVGWVYQIPEFGSIMLSEDSLKPYTQTEVKENIEVREMKVFKGVDYKYANLYEQNKAIEELIDFRVKYEIEKSGHWNIVKIINNELSSEETVFLNKHIGYGGMAEFGAKGIELLYEYFTPDEIVKMMWGLAYKYGFKKGGLVLEPSVGTGRFFKYSQENQNRGAEIKLYSAIITKILYPEAIIFNNHFEQYFIKNNLSVRNKISDIPKYDLVIGNPPYGDISQGSSKWMGMGEDKYSKATNYIDYFIFRGLDMLVGGGLLIYIVGAEKHAGGSLFLEKGNNKTKEMIAGKAELVDAYKLPAKLFETTKVSTEIIVLKRL